MTNLNTPGDLPPRARVSHRLTLNFDTFGWQSLEAEAARDGESLDELLGRSATYFGGELPTTRTAVLAPRFKLSTHGTPREIDISLTRECWERLETEAERQGISLERLLEHAALLHLADSDSGRVATRVLGRAAEGDDA